MSDPDLLPFEIRKTDFLIIGSGIAGLRAAIELSAYGEVLILNKGSARESNSAYAQGGIAAAINPYDSPQSHMGDTLKAGKGLCKRSAVKILVEEGILRVKELIDWGTRFDRKGNQLLFAQEAAHSRRRILRARGDATGDEIIRSLLSRVRSDRKIRLLNHHFSIDLHLEEGVCRGAWVLSESDQRPKLFLSNGVILATGGAGQIFLRTTNPVIATGDGMAMCYRKGVEMVDMEFVQFHPTALCLPGVAPFLLSEAMRGEGGILKNVNGEAFMRWYYPDAELAPRDMVSRAIWQEMERTGSDHIFLDMTSLSPKFLKKRFPTIYRTCLGYGIDLTRSPIPVSPSAHFMMGGARTDLNGMTAVPGLYAAGEVAYTGVHGANRLASNSLLEGLVFGTRAARHLLRHVGRHNRPGMSRPEIKNREFSQFGKKPPLNNKKLAQVERACKRLIWENAGIVRNGRSLKMAVKELKSWDLILKGSRFHRKWMEVKNMVCVALLVAGAALARRESLGAHYRSDYPKPSRKKVHSVLKIR